MRPKTSAVLQYLIRNSDRVITKQELRHAIWPDTHVSPALLKTYIRELRSLLRDDPDRPAFIKTIGRQGYEWIGDIREIKGGEERARTSPVLAGRSEELAYLHQRLKTALSGKRQVAFVSGEAGIGKTALIEAFLAQEANGPNVQIGRGQCIQHYGSAEAYLPLLEALTRLCHGPGGPGLVAILERHAPAWLVQMPAVLRASQRDTLQTAASTSTRERMLRELAEALEIETAERPIVLWLEDLQWSDNATLDWLAFAARRQEPARLMVIGTYRPVDMIVRSHPLKAIKQELQLHGYCEDLPLSFLPVSAVTEYLETRFGKQIGLPLQKIARVVHQRTEGNALFMINIVDYAIAHGAITKSPHGWRLVAPIEDLANAVPANLRELIEQELEGLTPAELEELEAASVAGQTFSAALVASAVGATIETVEQHCAEWARCAFFLRASGAMEWPDGTVAGGFALLHALYQQVLYERVPAGRRVRLHKRIAESLESAYGARASEIAAELADHFERGRVLGSALRYLWHAAKNAGRRYAPHEMVKLLRKALELLKPCRTIPNAHSKNSSC